MASPLDSTYGVWLVSLFLEMILYGMGILQTWIYFAACPTDMLSLKWMVSKRILDIFLGLTLARFLSSCVALRSFESLPSEILSIELWRQSKLCSSFVHRTFASSTASGSSSLILSGEQ
jgi:hypothetical protein